MRLEFDDLLYNAFQHFTKYLFILDPASLHFVFINSPALHDLQYDVQEVPNLDLMEVFPDLSIEQLGKTITKLQSHPAETVSCNLLIKFNDGRLLKTDVQFSQFTWASKTYVMLLADDSIVNADGAGTIYHESTGQLVKEHEDQLSLIYNTALHPMLLLKVEGARRYRYESINSAYAKAFGVTKEQVIGKYFGDFMILEDLEEMLNNLNKAAQTCETVRFLTKNTIRGHEKQFEVTVVPIPDESGKCTQVLGTANDVTEILKAKEELIVKNRELQQLTSHLQDVREEERTNMAREIHDELGQQLTGIKMDLAWLQRKLSANDEAVANKLKSSLELADRTINTVRRISSELHPSILDDLGLSEAMEWYKNEFHKRTGIEVAFQSNISDDPINHKAALALYRIYQEALTNVARHSGASKVTSSLITFDDSIQLIIVDNGKGFSSDGIKRKRSLGLLSMKERATMLNGSHQIESSPGKGTSIIATIPIGENKK